tara:strand:+ start:829 stop:1044 length:216 start_codon:yes stop_codon:yes gene_type:complete
MKRKFDKAEIVFNDSYESNGFEYGVSIVNKLLKSHNLKINLTFIDDYVSNEGEFAWEIKMKKINEKEGGFW